jgi:hypothetical protein
MKRSKTKRKIGEWMSGVTLAGMVVGSMATAQDALQTLEPLKVVGSEEELFKLLGSGAFVGMEIFPTFRCAERTVRGVRS